MVVKNRILVAYDGSPEAVKAFEHAVSIAEPGEEVEILMVIPRPETEFCTEVQDEQSMENMKAQLESLQAKFQDPDLRFITTVRRGDIVEEIIRASERSNCKLIVMGYVGVSRLGRFKLGSVSGLVAKKANKPLLIVR